MSAPTRARYVLRLIQKAEIPQVARIQYDAFNDPTNTTPDEIASILNSEPDPTQGRPLTRDETIAERTTKELELFAQNTHIFVGSYLVPQQDGAIPDGIGRDLASTDLPEGSTLTGFAVWQRVTPSTPRQTDETRQTAQREPNLLNRFFAQMVQTREARMNGRDYWFLKLLSMDPQHQRRGVGSMLVRWGVEKANQEHVDAWLESSPMGKGAYLKAGFRVLGMDRVDEVRAQRGYVEWPYMIHEYKPPQ